MESVPRSVSQTREPNGTADSAEEVERLRRLYGLGQEAQYTVCTIRVDDER